MKPDIAALVSALEPFIATAVERAVIKRIPPAPDARTLRLMRCLTLTEVARMSRVPTSHISRMEAGLVRSPGVKNKTMIARLAHVLSVSVEEYQNALQQSRMKAKHD